MALVSLGLLKREHSRRRRSEIRMARLAQGVDQGDVLVTIVNRKGRIEYVNRAVESTTGFSSEELLAPRSGRWFPWYAEDRTFEEVRDALLAGRAYRGTVSCQRKDGTPFLLEEHVTPMQEGKERTARFVSTSRDVTRQKQVEERLFQLDRFDPLTGVPHRRHFLALLQDELAQRGGEELAVLVMDVERFKYINDIFSPEVGDEMLRHVAGVLRELVGAHGTVGRLGSDEFGVFYRSSAAEARTLAERILGALARETHIAGHDIAVTVSIGVALAAQDFSDAGTLLKNADTALTFAKTFGRNSVRFFTRELSERAFHDYADPAPRRGRLPQRRVPRPLPAVLRPRQRPHLGRRGAHPLGERRAGSRVPCELHPRAGGVGTDPLGRRVGAAHRVPADPRVGALELAASDRREPVPHPVRPPRPGGPRRGRGERARDRPSPADTGADGRVFALTTSASRPTCSRS